MLLMFHIAGAINDVSHARAQQLSQIANASTHHSSIKFVNHHLGLQTDARTTCTSSGGAGAD